jgi:hypothetical protein
LNDAISSCVLVTRKRPSTDKIAADRRGVDCGQIAFAPVALGALGWQGAT